MKKFLSILLMAAMLLTLISSVMIGVAANEPATEITPEVYAAADYATKTSGLRAVYASVISGNVTYNADGSEKVDWSTASFSHLHTQTQINVADYTLEGTNYPAQVEVIAAYETATTIKKLVFYNNYWTGRLNNFNVSLSTDGNTWTKMFTISGLGHAKAERYVEYTIPDSYATTKWTHIKIDKTGAGWAQLNGVITLTDVKPEGIVNTTPYQSTSEKWPKVWSLNNPHQVSEKGQTETGDSDAIPVFTSAKFDCPTKVTSIKFYLGPQGNRMRNGVIYASDDGQTWKSVGKTAPGNDPYVANTFYVHTFEEPITCTYLKLEQDISLAAWDYSLLRVEVYGTAVHDGTFAKLDDNQHSKTCSCGETVKEDHLWDKTEETTPAGCATPGEKTLTCTACGATKTEPIPEKGHTFDQMVVEEKYLEAAADCKNPASYHYSCVCGEKGSNTFTTGDISHSFSEEWTGDKTNHWHKCENCTAITFGEAHTFGDWTVVTEASATVDGAKERTCTVCSYKETETIPATGETETNPTTDEKKSGGCVVSVFNGLGMLAMIAAAGVTFVKKKKS